MRWVVIGIAAALVGLLVYGVAQQDSKTSLVSSVQTGKAPPGATKALPVLARAGTQTIADFKGKVVLVNFWASWCPPCTAELPLLQRAQKTLSASGATVLGINSRDNTEDALRWVDRNKLTYPSLRDGSGDFAQTWGVYQLPESYVLDRDGKVVAALKGPLSQKWIDANVIPVAKR